MTVDPVAAEELEDVEPDEEPDVFEELPDVEVEVEEEDFCEPDDDV